MTIQFDPVIKKKQAITYIYDTIFQSQNKDDMFTVINGYHTLLRNDDLNRAPDKTWQNEWPNLTNSWQNEWKTWRVLNRLEIKGTSWKFLDTLASIAVTSRTSTWAVTFFTTRSSIPPLSNGDTNTRNSLNQSKTGTSKTRFSQCLALSLFSAITWVQRNGRILIQQFLEVKRINSFNCRIFDEAEQKISTLHRENCGIASALQTYEQ